MISAILYGRNDSHGYNLHKRAAISLNCIAEALSDPDDEILFVDYNTPNDLPTFIEAIYDTLTPRAKRLLRVFRVRPELHARLVKHTHLFALEPHSRNIAIRRSNPRNRWVLFTNTDMIFVPREPAIGDITGAVRDLPDGQYILPRFELPEPLWESFPRTDPIAIMRACEELGRKLHLNEVAISHPYMRFDSPGDFQLAPRQALCEIHGFDERMIHGWHADSNLCKRLFLFYGNRTESLAHRLKGYHCDHTRVATLTHRLDIKLENDLQEFVYGVKDPVAPDQAKTWGAPDEVIEEVDFDRGPQGRFAAAVESAIEVPQDADYQSDANELRNFVYYRAEHALPYVAANLTVLPPNARFAYIGNNARMLDLVARCVSKMGFGTPLAYASGPSFPQAYSEHAVAIPELSPDGGTGIAERLLAQADLLIFDFGLDPAGRDVAAIGRVTEWPREMRWSLGAVAQCLENCAEKCGALRRDGRRIPEFVVVNANHWVFRQFVNQFLLATDTPYNTHVRKGRPRLGEERLYRSHSWKYTEERMRSFVGYGEENLRSLEMPASQVLDFTSSGSSSAFKDGDWGLMDLTGTWTDGGCAAIVFRPPETLEDLIAEVRITEAFLSLNDDPLEIDVFLERERMARWLVRSRYGNGTFKMLLPAASIRQRPACRLEFQIINPQSPKLQALAKRKELIGDDPRLLGIKVRSITFRALNQLRYCLGDVLDFTEKGRGEIHVNECWTEPDDLGTWTLGPDANLVLLLSEPPETPITASFLITDAAVNEAFPYQRISVSFNGRNMANWVLGPTRLVDERKVFVPLDVIREKQPLTIAFHIEQPRTPDELKWDAGDTRPLGFRLTRLRFDPVRTPKYKLGDVIDFTTTGNGSPYLNPQWSQPDCYGAWTVGPEAALKLEFEHSPKSDVKASFVVSDCMVSKSVPALPVDVRANGELIAHWQFGPDRVPHVRSVELPAHLLSARRDLTLTFQVPEPRSPESLGWSTDSRPLGIRLARALVGNGELAIPQFGGAAAAGTSLGRRIFALAEAAVRGLRTAGGGAS